MLKLIKNEFRKLHRRPLILLATLAAILVPIPISVLAAKTGQGYDFLFKTAINIGHFVLLIPVLSVIAAMIFFEERDNRTLRALLTIPVSSSKLTWAKLTVLLIVSILYSVFAYIATIIGATIGQIQIAYPLEKLFLCMVMGVMTWVASLPCIALLVKLSKNYVFAVLVSFLYAILGLILTSITISYFAPNLSMLLPVSVISRWLLPIFQNLNTAKYPFDIEPCKINTPFCIFYLSIYTVLFGWLICKGFEKWKE